jgi:hypothetical protein
VWASAASCKGEKETNKKEKKIIIIMIPLGCIKEEKAQKVRASQSWRPCYGCTK